MLDDSRKTTENMVWSLGSFGCINLLALLEDYFSIYKVKLLHNSVGSIL